MDLIETLDTAGEEISEEVAEVADPTQAASDQTEQVISDSLNVVGLFNPAANMLSDQEKRDLAGDAVAGDLSPIDVVETVLPFESSPLKVAAVVGGSFLIARELGLFDDIAQAIAGGGS